MPLTRTRRSLPPISTAALLAVAILSASLLFPAGARAQLQRSYTLQREDARLPGHGRMWVQLAFGYENWSEQYARDNANWEDGARRPLSADYDGPIVNGYFPGLDPVLADLNSDADALGFDPLAPNEFRQGKLQFGTITATTQAFWFSVSVGLLDRIALEMAVPVVRTKADPSYVFDPVGATMIAAGSAVTDPVSYFGQYNSSLGQLQNLIDGGSLSPAEQAAAEALLSNAFTFGQTLFDRVDINSVLPKGATPAGDQLEATYANLQSGFSSFGLTLPLLALPTETTASDLLAFFGAGLVAAELPATTTQGLTFGELEPAIKVGLLDTFSPDRTRSFELRTSAQALVRIPTGAADGSPFLNPDNFLSLPIGDGQWDVELSLFQDVAARWFLFNIAARYGIQMSDELTLRVRSSGLRFPLAETSATVRRDLGDYFNLRLAPRVRVGDVVSLGVEYDYWRKGRDAYSLVRTDGTASSAAPLEIHTGQTRHRLGFSASYSTLFQHREDEANFPVELWFVYQSALGGGGGQTPAAELVTVSLMFPVRLF